MNKFNYYQEGNQCWFVWDSDGDETVTLISLHGAIQLAKLFPKFGFMRDENLKRYITLIENKKITKAHLLRRHCWFIKTSIKLNARRKSRP